MRRDAPQACAQPETASTNATPTPSPPYSAINEHANEERPRVLRIFGTSKASGQAYPMPFVLRNECRTITAPRSVDSPFAPEVRWIVLFMRKG